RTTGWHRPAEPERATAPEPSAHRKARPRVPPLVARLSDRRADSATPPAARGTPAREADRQETRAGCPAILPMPQHSHHARERAAAASRRPPALQPRTPGAPPPAPLQDR